MARRPHCVSYEEKTTEWFEKACALLPSLRVFHNPSRNPAEEHRVLKESFAYQSVDATSPDRFAEAAASYYAGLPNTPRPSRLASLDGLLSLPTFLAARDQVRADASPGYPGCLVASKKGELLDTCLTEIHALYVARILMLSEGLPMPQDPEALLRTGVTEPFQLLLKNEVKKKTKLTRVVLMVGVVQELIERAIFGAAAESMLADCGRASMLGLSFDAASSDLLYAGLQEPVFKSDMTKFDYSVEEHQAFMTNEYRLNLYEPRPAVEIYHVARGLVHLTMRKVIVLSDGSVYAQKRPGVRPTGQYRTSTDNTDNREVRGHDVALLMGHRPVVKAAGDDAVENCGGRDLTEAYRTLGYKVRDGALQVEPIEFCSHWWKRGERPVGDRFEKALATLLLCGNLSQEQVLAFYQAFDNHPRFQEGLALLLASGTPGLILHSYQTQQQQDDMPTTRAVNGRTASASKQMGMGAMVVWRRKPAPRRRKATRRRPRRALALSPRAGPAMHLSHQLCSVLDPFCKHAQGARLWGDSGALTIPLTWRGVASFQSTQTNARVWFFYPDVYYGYGQTTAAAGVTTLPVLNTWPTATAQVSARVVSAGFVLRCTSNAMTVEGSVYIVPLSRYTVGDTFTGTPTMLDSRALIVPATKDMEVAVSCVRRGSGAYDFHYFLDGTNNEQPDYQCWMLYFPPTVATVNYEIEMVVHIESNPTLSQQSIFTAGNATTGSRVPQSLAPIADKVSGQLTQAVATTAGKAAESFGKQAATLAFRAAAGAVGAYVGGPRGALAGYSGAAMLQNAIEVD